MPDLLHNLITDVPGIRVGNAADVALRSGVTVLLANLPLRAAMDVRGGGTGTRESAALQSEGVVSEIHGLVLSGGSAFGLDAATGVQSYLRENDAGFAVGPVRVPIVPQAILFDLLNGGDKDWGRYPPYRDLAYEACHSAGKKFALGSVGAGFGATTVTVKGGLGSASQRTDDGFQLGALVAVNAAGSPTIGDTPHFWAAPLEQGGEFGGLGWPDLLPKNAHAVRLKGSPGENTTLGIVATDAALGKAELKRLAIMTQMGFARALYPVHTPLDGDIVFAVSTGEKPLTNPVWQLARLGTMAANTMARAIARGIYAASAIADDGTMPKTWRDLHATF